MRTRPKAMIPKNLKRRKAKKRPRSPFKNERSTDLLLWLANGAGGNTRARYDTGLEVSVGRTDAGQICFVRARRAGSSGISRSGYGRGSYDRRGDCREKRGHRGKALAGGSTGEEDRDLCAGDGCAVDGDGHRAVRSRDRAASHTANFGDAPAIPASMFAMIRKG